MPMSPPPPHKTEQSAPLRTDDRASGTRGAAVEQSPVGPQTVTTVPLLGPVPFLARVPGFILAITGLALTSGTIHVVAFIEHVGLNWQLGAFFALVGVAQVLASSWIYRNPDDTRMLKVTAAGSVVVSLMWVFSRTTGIPFGPEPGRAAVGVADTITTLQQFILAAIVVASLRRRDGEGQPLSWMGGALATRIMFAFLTSTMLMAAIGGHQH